MIMKTKTYLAAFLLSSMALLCGCAKEQDFVIKGEPYFSADVIETVVDGSNETEVLVTTLKDNVWYELTQSGDAYSAATNANNHVRKAVRFKVSSNLRWKIVPADYDAATWVHPFPDNGEKDGIFFFKADRNVSADTPRDAFFNVLVDKGSGFEPLEGMIRVIQSESSDFLELSTAKFNATALEQTFKLRVLANVDWTYTLEPMDDYGTPDVAWIEDRSTHEVSKQIDTLNLRIAANETGVRGANLIISYSISGRPATEVVPIVQYPAEEVDLPGFPVKWAVRVTPNTYDATWPANGTITPVSGAGLIRFNNEAGKAADVNGKCLLDVSDNCPRVQGPWPGDYCEFIASAPVSAGTVIKISFATRVSGTGHKYWRLEYRDGEEWYPAGKILTDEAVMGPDGEPVRYTHAMAADGSTNIKVENVVVYKNNTDQVEFRFICAANWQANGSGALSAPNGGTWRLAVDTKDAADEYQPTISCVAAGAEVLVQANMEVNASYLSFNGTNAGSKTITVSSDQPLTVSSENSWIHADPAVLDAGENMTVTVTVDDSELTSLREGSLTLKAGVTRRDIPVIQGAAGQNLDPFISIVGKNSLELEPEAGSYSVRLQGNVAVSAETAADWITLTPATATKGLVEYTDYLVEYTANEGVGPREALIRFYDEASGAQALLPVTQKAAEAVLENDLVQWGFSATLMADYKDSFEKSNAFKANIAGTGTLSWHGLAENDALDVNTKRSQVIGGTGQPYVTGVWPGDYWLFTIPLVQVAKGDEITFTALHKVSATGQKYWKMEYSIDGSNWFAVKELQTETETGTNAQYTHKLETTGSTSIKETIVAPMDIPSATLQIRFTCVANWQQKGGALEAPNGGTHRWDGAESSGPKLTVETPTPEPPVVDPDPAVKAKVGDVLWEEWFNGATANQKPSDYSASEAKTTVVFGGGKVEYSETGATDIRVDGLVFYDKVANLTVENYRNNVLIASGNNTLTAEGIPCPGVKKAKLTYRSNTKLSAHQVSSETSGVSVGTLESTQEVKLDMKDAASPKYTNIITCTIDIAEGTNKLDLIFKNIASSNIRVDGFELVVTEIW